MSKYIVGKHKEKWHAEAQRVGANAAGIGDV